MDVEHISTPTAMIDAFVFARKVGLLRKLLTGLEHMYDVMQRMSGLKGVEDDKHTSCLLLSTKLA